MSHDDSRSAKHYFALNAILKFIWIDSALSGDVGRLELHYQLRIPIKPAIPNVSVVPLSDRQGSSSNGL